MLLTPMGAEASLQPPEMSSGRAWEASHHSEAQHAFQKGEITAHFSFPAFCLFFFLSSLLAPPASCRSTVHAYKRNFF